MDTVSLLIGFPPLCPSPFLPFFPFLLPFPAPLLPPLPPYLPPLIPPYLPPLLPLLLSLLLPFLLSPSSLASLPFLSRTVISGGDRTYHRMSALLPTRIRQAWQSQAAWEEARWVRDRWTDRQTDRQ